MNENNNNNVVKSYLIALMGIFITLFLDQFTKWLAVTHLKGKRSISIIEGVFQLHYLENKGAAFGVMQGQSLFLITGAVIVSVIVLYLYGLLPASRKYRPIKFCAVLLVSGAVGNLIDRLRFQYVIDFFYFELIDFPVFNVADCYVVVSCILFIILMLFYYKSEEDFSFIKLPKAGSRR